MEIINVAIAFVQAHWVDILAVLGGLDLILGIVSKWTPFKWDDNLYSLLHGFIAKLGKKGPNS